MGVRVVPAGFRLAPTGAKSSKKGFWGSICIENTISRSSMDPLSVNFVPTGVMGVPPGVLGVPLGVNVVALLLTGFGVKIQSNNFLRLVIYPGFEP